MKTDRIEKRVVLRAPRSRVWRALTDAAEFGSWFGARLAGRFALGERVSGPITIPGYEHVTMDIAIERLEPESSSPGAGIPMPSSPASTTRASRRRSSSSTSRRRTGARA